MKSLDDHVREFQYNQCIMPSCDSLGKIAWVRVYTKIRFSIAISLSCVNVSYYIRVKKAPCFTTDQIRYSFFNIMEGCDLSVKLV